MSKSTKKYEVQPTEQQKQAAEAVLAQKATGKNINYSKALKVAGYSDSIQKSPGQITKSKGYRAYLAKYDLQEDSIAAMIKADIDAIPPGEATRFNYIKMVAGMLGMLDPNINVNVTQSDEGLELIKGIITGESEIIIKE